MTYTRMDNRLEIDAAMALWEAYVVMTQEPGSWRPVLLTLFP